MSNQIAVAGASDKRATVLKLRWLLVLALGYLLLFHSDTPVTHGPIPWIVLGYLLSNAALTLLPRRYFLLPSFDRVLILLDTVIVSAALSQAGFQTQNLFVFYFLIMLLTTLGKGLGGIIANGLIIVGIYAFFLIQSEGWAVLAHSGLLLQIPFLIIAAVFYGVLVDQEHGRYRKTIEQLQAASEAVASHLDLDAMLKIILDTVTRLMDADTVSVMLLEPDGRSLRLVQGRGIPDQCIGNAVVRIGEGVAGRIAETGQPLLIQGPVRQGEFKNHTPMERLITSALSVPIKTRAHEIGVPLKTEGRVIGVLNASVVSDRRKFDQQDLQILTLFASNISTALEHAKLFSDRVQAEETIRHQAYHDLLTDLPNRALFNDRLTLALAHAGRSGQRAAVMFLDLDHFKLVNDMMGHAVGDRLLKATAERITGCLRKSDTVARLGGDEFMLLLPELHKGEDAATIAKKILEALKPPFNFDGHEFYITSSIGISLCPDDGEDAQTLIKSADIAMYRVKEYGRNNYQFFGPAMRAAASERLVLESGLRRALERQELVVHYQPLVNLQTGKIIGAEALVRWRHPELGLISPARFIPLAEETGLILPIGEWVLRTACAQNKAWQAASGVRSLRMTANLSNLQFKQKNLTGTIARIVTETGLNPRDLELELTESGMMQNVETTVAMLRELKAMGVRISIDDFGTGYSSLNNLKRFPVDTLKIDPSFVRNVTNDPGNAAIATAIVAMAHGLRLEVIAEGVETVEELEFLRSLQCDGMQGFLFSRPVEAEAFTQLLMEGRSLTDRKDSAG